MDLDGSDSISFQEFEEVFGPGIQIDSAELRQIFYEIDTTKNDLINFEEFKVFLKQMFRKFKQFPAALAPS